MGKARREGCTIGLVPTMGALHEGHLSLVRRSVSECDFTVVTIFVNPTQFGPREDFTRYPRKFDADIALLAQERVDLVFAPDVDTIYPEGFSTHIEPPNVAGPLEGECRPGHFRGVVTIVLKLFNLVPADVAYFGQKDYQQARVIQDMVRDLNVAVTIDVCPIVREADGLALSSRNRYLSAEERARARSLYRALEHAVQLVRRGQHVAQAIGDEMRAVLIAGGITDIEYAAVVDPQTLLPVDVVAADTMALIAARVGTTRLIDNCRIGDALHSPNITTDTAVRSTLFYIPHADPFFGIPLFGTGWLLLLLVVSALGILVFRVWRYGWNREAWNEVPLFVVLAVAIVWGGPVVEEHTAAGEPIGVPIRGYGVMVLLGIVASVLLLARESRRMGIHPDYILSLAFLMVLAGFIGARTFYVIEYWHRFSAPTWGKTLVHILKLTDGGLVVYGSFIGASLAVVWFVRKHKLPLLAIADLLAAPMMLGVALGRIGCFLNGCCWGAMCGASVLGVTFPQGSPPFIAQIENGTLLDMRLEAHSDRTYTVQRVEPGGLGDRAGLERGDTIERLVLPDQTAFSRMRHGESTPEARVSLVLAAGRIVSWEFAELPPRSAPVYPAQIFSSMNAALICLFLWAYYPFRRRDGEIAALLVSIYPVTRFLLELIRADEPSLWATDMKMTISQSISVALLAGVVGLWIFVLTRPKGSALPATSEGGRP